MNDEQSKSTTPKKGRGSRLAIVVILAIAIAAVLYFKGTRTGSTSDPSQSASAKEEIALSGDVAYTESEKQEALPRLIDLGADKCIPCKMMAPILEELRKEFAGQFEVVFIDVWKKKSEAQKYGIRVIPTQIFFDAEGKELFRHQGFFSKEDILKTWQEHGFDFGKTGASEGSS